MQLGEEALNSDAVVTLVHQIGDICLNEKVHPAVAMTAFQILFRASIALLGEEEKHLLDTHLAEFGIELLSISVLKMVLGTSDKFKQEEGKDTDIIWIYWKKWVPIRKRICDTQSSRELSGPTCIFWTFTQSRRGTIQ